MAEPSVIFDAVWKMFRRGEHHNSLRDLIPAMVRRFTRARQPGELAREEFWAVRDVSFQARSGDSLGIIGPNGAGKSTILKLLTRILKPTRGHCGVCGRVGALIEVAAGFHPDLTGRENVYLQGAIMGMKRHEISRKFDEIVDFSGVREFIETPVKRYSSGMNARLGFAIAAHLDPEVLIIDEVLSVGDFAFQQRCVTRMRGLLRQGIPLVFVSHNLQAVQELCNKVLVLNRGQVAFLGAPQDGIREYRRMSWTPPANQEKQERHRTHVWISGVLLLDESRSASDFYKTGAEMTVRIQYEAQRPLDRIHFAVELHRSDGVCCYGINTNMDRKEFSCVEGRGTVELRFPALSLLPGSYSLSVGIRDRDGFTALDAHHLAYQFIVASERKDHGLVYLEHEWRQPTVSDAAVACGEHAKDGE